MRGTLGDFVRLELKEKQDLSERSTFMNKEKITILRWYDIVILTLILIGHGILNSTLQFLDMLKNPVIP